MPAFRTLIGAGCVQGADSGALAQGCLSDPHVALPGGCRKLPKGTMLPQGWVLVNGEQGISKLFDGDAVVP